MAGPTRFVGVASRYGSTTSLITSRDPFEDLVNQLSFFLSSDYTVEVLTTDHGVPRPDAVVRAPAIRAHVAVAASYISQALSGPQGVSFLPCYYALLNLIKVYILFSPRHADLASNRWHGASYRVDRPDPASLPDDDIQLKTTGAIPLFYEVLTGAKIGYDRTVKLAEIYPYISDVGLEWQMSSGGPFLLARLQFSDASDGQGRRLAVHVSCPDGVQAVSLPEIGALRNCQAVSSKRYDFVGMTAYPAATPDLTLFDDILWRPLLYHPHLGETITPIVKNPDLLPVEEIPILLAFFHMGSVVRYKPQLLEQLQDSRY